MLKTTNEAAINGTSLKFLFIGLKLTEKPELMADTQRRFGLTYPNLPSFFPYDRYLEMLDWLREQLFPAEDEASGYELIGRAIASGFFDEPAGQVIKITAKLMGWHRAVPIFFRVIGGALPFGRFEIVESKPCYLRSIIYNVPGSPEIMRGMTLTGMEVANIKEPSIVYIKLNPGDTEYISRWSE